MHKAVFCNLGTFRMCGLQLEPTYLKDANVGKHYHRVIKFASVCVYIHIYVMEIGCAGSFAPSFFTLQNWYQDQQILPESGETSFSGKSVAGT